MGSLSRKITKKANKFNKALSILEKHLESEAAKDQEVPRPFDLTKTVENELAQSQEAKRKARNKRKAEKRKLKKNK